MELLQKAAFLAVCSMMVKVYIVPVMFSGSLDRKNEKDKRTRACTHSVLNKKSIEQKR